MAKHICTIEECKNKKHAEGERFCGLCGTIEKQGWCTNLTCTNSGEPNLDHNNGLCDIGENGECSCDV